jgi:acyl-CoA reductase-like NAD-dependent aldehyde dehydrogenase
LTPVSLSAAISGKTFATLNPSTGQEICQVAEADAADVDLDSICTACSYYIHSH